MAATLSQKSNSRRTGNSRFRKIREFRKRQTVLKYFGEATAKEERENG